MNTSHERTFTSGIKGCEFTPEHKRKQEAGHCERTTVCQGLAQSWRVGSARRRRVYNFAPAGAKLWIRISTITFCRLCSRPMRPPSACEADPPTAKHGAGDASMGPQESTSGQNVDARIYEQHSGGKNMYAHRPSEQHPCAWRDQVEGEAADH